MTPVNYYTPSYYSFDLTSIYEKIPQYSFEVQVWVVQQQQQQQQQQQMLYLYDHKGITVLQKLLV